MNITTILTTLQEEMAIDKYREKAKSVPTEVMDKLASVMKRDKFDNTAMAVMKAIQTISNKEKRDYLIDHPIAVYTIMRKAKRGSDNYNPQDLLNNYIASEDPPRTFWKNALTTVSNNPPQPKPNYGLKNATIRKVGNEFLVFPRTLKTTNEFGLSGDDTEKQWRELKAISDELAKKDTSGKDGADVNHWCVASSDNAYYEGYKENGGIFIIILKQTKDGKPDYNNRYLLFLPNSDENEMEFADKFDNHLELEDEVSEPTEIFIDGIRKKLGKGSRARSNREARDRLTKAFTNEWDSETRKKTEDAKALEKLIPLINSWVKTKSITMGDVAEELKKLPLDSPESLENFFKKNVNAYGYRLGKIIIQRKDYWGQKDAILIRDPDTKGILLRCYCDGDFEIAQAYMKRVINHRRPSMVLGNKGYEEIGKDKLGFIFPFDVNDKSLRGNKALEKAFSRERESGIPEAMVLVPDKLVLKRNSKDRKYELYNMDSQEDEWPYSYRKLCDLRDRDMLTKVRNLLYNNPTNNNHEDWGKDEDWS